MTPLEQITERVMRHGHPEDREVATPLLTLEEFFEGNDFAGSIGCNLIDEPAPEEFYDLLKDIRSRADVSDVRIQITCVDDPGNDWPFSDTIWIMTSSNEESIKGWFPERLGPDDVWEGWTNRMHFEDVTVDPAHRPVAVWYD